MNAEKDHWVVEDKRLRQEFDRLLQELNDSNRHSRERALAVTKIQEAIMWLGRP